MQVRRDGFLGSSEHSLGCNGEVPVCMIGSIEKGLRQALDIPSCYQILLVVALGRAKERAVVESVGFSGDIKY